MTDVFEPSKRSSVMAAIRGKGNRSTELRLASGFRKVRLSGWRRHIRLKVPKGKPSSDGKNLLRTTPDFVFLRAKVAVFVDGCFWHGCPVHATKPKSNAAFWRAKLQA